MNSIINCIVPNSGTPLRVPLPLLFPHPVTLGHTKYGVVRNESETKNYANLAWYERGVKRIYVIIYVKQTKRDPFHFTPIPKKPFSKSPSGSYDKLYKRGNVCTLPESWMNRIQFVIAWCYRDRGDTGGEHYKFEDFAMQMNVYVNSVLRFSTSNEQGQLD